MTFGLTPEKLLLIGLIAVLIIGPERLPRYAEKFAQLVRKGSEALRGARDRVTEEMGSDFSETDWRKLDPRQYDPRRIIREALLEQPDLQPATDAQAEDSTEKARDVRRLRDGEVPPFDDEAT